MKQLLIKPMTFKKICTLSLGAFALSVGMGNLQAKTINAEAGMIFSKFSAELQCKRAAAKLKGQWNGRYWTKPGSFMGVCQIIVPDPIPPKPVKHPPIKPSVKLISVDAGRLWSEAHAKQKCPQLAKKEGGRWNGKWSDKTDSRPSYCQVEILVKPVIPKPTHKYMDVKAGTIWSPEHAKVHCRNIAKKQNGEWTGKFLGKRGESTCQIKVPVAAPVIKAPVPPKPVSAPPKPHSRNIREVSAGPIWDQRQAAFKCPLIAKQTNGEWTGIWRKTDNNTHQSVCEIKLQSLREIQAQTPPATQPAPTPAPTPAAVGNAHTREVAAGPIWDQAQAAQKCPVIAAKTGEVWTGRFRKLDYSTHQSVCVVRKGSTASAPTPTKTVVTTQTTYVSMPAPAAASNTREIYAGPIWDANQAQVKCPIIARNNKGSWTGKWRKTGPDHSSLCEVRF